MAKRESYIESMTGIPDGTQDTADKDSATPEVQEASREPQPTGQAKAFLDAYSRFASNSLDILAGQLLLTQDCKEELTNLAELTNSTIGKAVEDMLTAGINSFSRRWLVPGFTPEVRLSDSINGENPDVPGEVFGNSLYVRLFNSLKSAARADWAVEEEKARAAGKELPQETDTARTVFCKAATDYFFLVNYERFRPMDGGELAKTRQEEAGKYYGHIKRYAADNSISDIEKALYPKGILWDDTQLPKATPEYLQFIFEFSESERAAGETTVPESQVTAAILTNLAYPLDKVNSVVWTPDGMEMAEDGYYHIATEKDDAKEPIDILYKIDFDEMEKKLDAATEKWANTKGSEVPQLITKTKRVMIACNELYKHGNIFSLTQIYHAMGYEGRPAINQLDDINNQLKLLSAAQIVLDNSQEIDAGYKYPKFYYEGAMMPNERVKAFINGKWTEKAVRVFRQPPLMEFAEGRGQITTIGIKLLSTPINKTENNLKLEDYLLQRIARMGKKTSHKIRYTTIYQKCGITEKKEKQRALEKISTILNHYKKEKYIKGFSVTKEKDGINIVI